MFDYLDLFDDFFIPAIRNKNLCKKVFECKTPDDIKEMLEKLNKKDSKEYKFIGNGLLADILKYILEEENKKNVSEEKKEIPVEEKEVSLSKQEEERMSSEPQTCGEKSAPQDTDYFLEISKDVVRTKSKDNVFGLSVYDCDDKLPITKYITFKNDSEQGITDEQLVKVLLVRNADNAERYKHLKDLLLTY